MIAVQVVGAGAIDPTAALGSKDLAEGAREGLIMLVLLDTPQNLDVCEAELGCPVEQLLTPLTRRTRQRLDRPFAIDNGAFATFKQKEFLALLERERPSLDLCQFVAVPDVVGNALRTLEIFEHWRYRLSGWKLAFVIQDGIESVRIPWAEISAIFIGGTTEFKMGKQAADCIKAAIAIGKWVHVGRVNTPGRYEHFEELGADSIDGTGLSRYTWMRQRIHEEAIKPNLFESAEQNIH